MTTILFVHGTGVRRKAYERSLALVREGITAHRDDVEIAPCLWGEKHGVRLQGDGLSIPTYGSTRGVDGDPTDEEVEVARWARLYADPEAELELLRLKGGEEEAVPGRLLPGAQVLEAFRRLEATGPLAPALARAGLADGFEAARDTLAKAPTVKALAASPVGGTALREGLARALVAQILAARARLDPDVPWPVAADRDGLVEAMVVLLGGRDRGVADWIGGCFKSFGSHLATFYATRQRRSLMDGASPVVGDILLYQARGGLIRDFIEKRFLESGAEWILAHSLGGIASFELLATKALPGIKGLITVGSQAPWFYEIDVLNGLRFHVKELPDSVPAWLNIYDRRDLLSYVGGYLFPHRCHDVRVDGGQPFPAAHSAYWSNEAVFAAIATHLREGDA